MENEIKEIYLSEQERLRKTEGFTTGFSDLDIFCRFVEPGNILTIGGRPAMGKTAFSMSLVNHLLEKGKSVLYFSPGVSKPKVIQRIVSEKIGVPLFTLVNGKVREEELNIVLNSYENKKIEIVDKINLTIDDFEEKVKELQPEVVFVNYVQLLKMPKAPNLTEATNLAISEIKRIAVENNVVVVLLSQLSRSVEARCEKRPILSDLRNGSMLEELSDVIMMLYRDSYYNCQDDEDLPEYNEIRVIKNSTGPTGAAYLDFKNGFFRNRAISNEF